MRRILKIVPLLLLLPLLSGAQYMQYFKVQSGTGFFVNQAYIITNAHVVRGCNKVSIKGAVPEGSADVQVMDDEHDLALLETYRPPNQYAPLRFNIDELKTDDKVYVIGYPGEAGMRGEYTVAEAQVAKLAHDVQGNPWQFYITDVVEHGNSGGPVFDTSGNVIGVVVAKSVISTVNAVTQEKLSEQHVGVVITLNTLKDFLQQHGIYYEWVGSGLYNYDTGYITDRARGYIVNVQCRMPTDAAGNLLDGSR